MRSHQRHQARIEEDVCLCHVHAADELPQVRSVIQRHVGSWQQHVALQHTVQIHRQQLHALGQDQLNTHTHTVRDETQASVCWPGGDNGRVLLLWVSTCPADEGLAQFLR